MMTTFILALVAVTAILVSSAAYTAKQKALVAQLVRADRS